MRTKNDLFRILFLIPLLLMISVTYAQSNSISHEIKELLRKVEPDTQRTAKQSPVHKESPRFSITPDGYLRYIGAPPSHYFPVTSPAPGNAEVTAVNFLKENAGLFGVKSSAVHFRVMKTNRMANRDFVKFQQTYADIDVFAGQIIVLVNELGGVEYVMSDIARDLELLDEGTLSVVPLITEEEAVRKVKSLFNAESPNTKIITTEPYLTIFDPAVLGTAGGIRLVWDMKACSEKRVYINEHILLDAHSGKIVRRYPLNIPAISRLVYDAGNTDSDPGTLERSEGDGPSGIVDVDNAYDFLGDAYDFYASRHGRDGIDDDWRPIDATVRYCEPEETCPWANAMWSPDATLFWGRMYFGDGHAVDDIVGHEYTHGVTDYGSDLIYENHSGAINESFSDIWGEFIDLVNGAGTDTDAVRWLIGEDRPGNPWRDMQDPCLLGDPDRLGSPLFVQPVPNPDETNDWGGVHTNSGVGNKLCYLLTDGDTFNGQIVTGIGINATAELFYIVNAGSLITSGGDYIDLGNALEQAAILCSWSSANRNNLYRALVAVEIFRSGDIFVNWTNSGFEDGTLAFPFNTVAEGNFQAASGDRLWIAAGSYDESVIFDKVMQVNVYGTGSVVIGQ
jgi:bacillolysin